MILAAAVCLSLLSPEVAFCRDEKTDVMRICVDGACMTERQFTRYWKRMPKQQGNFYLKLYGAKP
jgi:hypothetical protein